MKNKNPTLPNYLGNHVHIVAGLSKDFGMAGMRVGYLFSHNQMLHQEVGNLGNFQSLS
jgi:histidinol-phosphate/aromatic aminotransferase/cobyric acid decarboxylase-like protein